MNRDVEVVGRAPNGVAMASVLRAVELFRREMKHATSHEERGRYAVPYATEVIDAMFPREPKHD